MAIVGERVRRKLHNDGKGLTGSITLLCDWTDVDPSYIEGLPKIGDAWPGIPYLKCVDIDADEIAANTAEVTAQYSTQGKLAESFYETSLDFSLETVDRARGLTWELGGYPVEKQIPVNRSVATYTIGMRATGPTLDAVKLASNRVNDRVFHGFAAGTLRFDGAATDEQYGNDGGLVSVYTSYKFCYNEDGHNYEWREPLQARDINGNLMYWQNIDSEQPYYSVVASVVGTPVWMSDAGGAAVTGTAGWDRPKHTDDNYLYLECDFATVLSLPTKTGDG